MRARLPVCVVGPGLLLLIGACATSSRFGDAGSDAGSDVVPLSDGGVTYADLSNDSNWVFFDTTAVDPNAAGYFGAAFDGRYVYFTPVQSSLGTALEYDTHSAFTVTKSWATFVLGDDAGSDNKFVGAAFDGHYLYLPPFGQAAATLARYDTQGTYTSASSWASVKLASVVTSAPSGVAGSVFVGGHVYLPPYGNSVALAYDPTGPLGTSSSWTSFDATPLVGASYVACSGASDGKFVYFAPFSPAGLVLRYDLSAPFGSAPSWTTFDTTTISPMVPAFEGAVFDGQYVYFVPSGTQFTASFAIRYDTHETFTDTASWASFDIKQANAAAGGFVGGAFDGRWVYYVPYGGAMGLSGIIARFDAQQASFSSPTAWQVFDLTTLNPNAHGYAGAAFDGRYLYLSPNLSAGSPAHVIARFDARTPPALPSTYAGSFF